MCDSGRSRSLLRRADAGHKRALTLTSLQRELDAPLASAVLILISRLGLGADRIWFARDAAVVAPSQFAYSALVNRSEQLGAPVMVVHPPAQMARVRVITSPAVPSRAELASVSRLLPAQKISAQVLSYTPNDLKIKVSCPADGWLLVTDRWAAGWRARVNGIPADVFNGNFIFRAVCVHGGENTIQFHYPQPLYFALVLLSWTTLVAAFAMPRWEAARPAKEVHQESLIEKAQSQLGTTN